MKSLKVFIGITLLIMTLGDKSFAQSTNPGEIAVTNFTTQQQSDGSLLINWVSEDAELANYYEVQESFDGIEFKTIAIVMGPDPQKAYGQYGLVKKVKKQYKKTAYLRLCHIDKDGNKQFSEIIKATK